MSDDTTAVRVVDNPSRHRYEAYLDDQLAGFGVYRLEPGGIVFLHTEVDPKFEGHGVGSQLAAAALDDARGRGLAVTPRCPFFAEYIRRHPDYADLVKSA